MMRQGDIGPSLALLQRAATTADAMEVAKKALKRGGAGPAKTVRRCEVVLDEAWGLVSAVERQSGPLAAVMVAEHWLLGMRWEDVSVAHGLSVDRCKKLAYKAVSRLDARQ